MVSLSFFARDAKLIESRINRVFSSLFFHSIIEFSISIEELLAFEMFL
jgi:hypothetical protein